MLLIENIKLALIAVKTNKMRSFLTMLGIIIGISSVIAITSIGASAKGAVSKQFESFGAGYMYLMINWEMTEDYISESDMIQQEDIDKLKERFSSDLLYCVPYAGASATTRVGRQDADLSLNGVGANYDQFYKQITMKYGRMLNQADIDGHRNNIVVDVKAAKYLFGTENVVGQTIPATIWGESLDMNIIGVYEEVESLFSKFDTSKSYSCYVPYTILADSYGTSYVEIYANPDKDLDAQGRDFSSYLAKIKGKADGFYKYESAANEMGMINNILNILSLAIGAIAAISLLVGGIGIMNIMLVSVTERTREIGIRKSLGARTKDIMTQFLIEAVILAMIGGIVGTILGIVIPAIPMMILDVPVVIEPLVILIAVVFSAGVGMCFGLFPARKAARLDPIEALRYE